MSPAFLNIEIVSGWRRKFISTRRRSCCRAYFLIAYVFPTCLAPVRNIAFFVDAKCFSISLSIFLLSITVATFPRQIYVSSATFPRCFRGFSATFPTKPQKEKSAITGKSHIARRKKAGGEIKNEFVFLGKTLEYKLKEVVSFVSCGSMPQVRKL